MLFIWNLIVSYFTRPILVTNLLSTLISFIEALPRLPVIQHPSARLGAPETISIAGRSSALSQSMALNEADSVLRAPSNFSRATSRTSATGTTRFTNATGSRVSKPETVARLAVDEIEALLKQKLSGAGHHQVGKNNNSSVINELF